MKNTVYNEIITIRRKIKHEEQEIIHLPRKNKEEKVYDDNTEIHQRTRRKRNNKDQEERNIEISRNEKQRIMKISTIRRQKMIKELQEENKLKMKNKK